MAKSKVVGVRGIDGTKEKMICLGYLDYGETWLVNSRKYGWRSVHQRNIDEVYVGQLRVWDESLDKMGGLEFKVGQPVNIPNNIVEHYELHYSEGATQYASISEIYLKSTPKRVR